MSSNRFIFFVLALFLIPFDAKAKIFVSTNLVQRGVWCSDLEQVVEKARTQHLPMMIVLGNEGCTYCSRLARALDGVAFNAWQKDRNILMAYAHNSARQSNKITPKSVKMAIPFFRNSRNQSFPLVYIWWPKNDGTEIGKVFTGRRDAMGSKSHDFLSLEFMSSVDKVLDEYLRTSHNKYKTLDQILRDSPKHIAVKASTGGSVSMVPEDGVLTEGEIIKINATANEKYVFRKWIGPDGSVAGVNSNLVVTGSMPEGTYMADFKCIAEIKPPILSSATTSICVRAGEPFTYAMNISEDCQPVSFNAKHLPSGIRFNPNLGMFFGSPQRPGTNIIEIAVIGSDASHTVATNRLTMIVQPKIKSRKKTRSRFSTKGAQFPHTPEHLQHSCTTNDSVAAPSS